MATQAHPKIKAQPRPEGILARGDLAEQGAANRPGAQHDKVDPVSIGHGAALTLSSSLLT